MLVHARHDGEPAHIGPHASAAAPTVPTGPVVAQPRQPEQRDRPRHAPGLRRCRRHGAVASRQLHLDAAGLRLRLRPALQPGPDGVGPDHRDRGVRAVPVERRRHLPVLLRAVQPDQQRVRRRRARRPAAGGGRGRARHRAGRRQRALGVPRRLRGAERLRRRGRSTCSTGSPATTAPRWSRRAGGTARPASRARTPPSSRPRSGIFDRMALQGQTIVAASGDAGSEDCYPDANLGHPTSLAVDDPGSQPDVVSAGGTSLPSASASSQVVWNDCQGQPTSLCGQLPGRRAAAVPAAADRRPCGRGLAYQPGFPRTAPCGARHRLSGQPGGRRCGRGLPGRLDRLRRHQCRRAHERRALRRHQPGLFQPAGPGRPGALRRRPAAGQRQLHRHHEREQRLHDDATAATSRPSPATTRRAGSAPRSTRTCPSPCRARTGAPRWRP